MGMVLPPTSRQQWPLKQTYRFSQALLLLWVTPATDKDIIEANFESNTESAHLVIPLALIAWS